MSKWQDFLKEQAEHRQTRKTLQKNDDRYMF